MKKFLSFLLAAALLMGCLALPASAAELPFTDVPESAWYKNAVTFAYEKGLFEGTGPTTFSPNAPMTRAMFVQVLSNKTSNYNKADWTGKSSFSDVNPNAWYAPAVEWASHFGIVSGVGGGKFEPDKNVTREQMAVIMYNYAKRTDNSTMFDSAALILFSDGGSVSSWAREGMQWAASMRIIKGSDNNRANPKSNAKRCEVAQVMMNADPVLAKTEVKLPEAPPSDMYDDASDVPNFARTHQLVKFLFEDDGGAVKVYADNVASDSFARKDTYRNLMLENGFSFQYKSLRISNPARFWDESSLTSEPIWNFTNEAGTTVNLLGVNSGYGSSRDCAAIFILGINRTFTPLEAHAYISRAVAAINPKEDAACKYKNDATNYKYGCVDIYNRDPIYVQKAKVTTEKELETFLKRKYHNLYSPMEVLDLELSPSAYFPVEGKKSVSISLDFGFVSSDLYTVITPLDFKSTGKYTTKQKEETYEMLKVLMQDIYQDVIDIVPDASVSGNIYVDGYEYPHIHVGYWSKKTLSWDNSSGDFHWTPERDTFQLM